MLTFFNFKTVAQNISFISVVKKNYPCISQFYAIVIITQKLFAAKINVDVSDFGYEKRFFLIELFPLKK